MGFNSGFKGLNLEIRRLTCTIRRDSARTAKQTNKHTPNQLHTPVSQSWLGK